MNKQDYLVRLTSQNMNDLAKKVEAMLFISGEGMALSKLASSLKKNQSEIDTALRELEQQYKDNHYLSVLRIDDRVSIVTSREVSDIVEAFAKDEFSGDVTEAGLDTLAIIAYKGPVRRSEIDYIRGVNSAFMVRSLLMRGLIERLKDPKDSRSYLYRISKDFLKWLGLTSVSDLPEYGSYGEKLEEFIKESTK